MKLGLVLPLFSGDASRVLDDARRAEALGYDGVFAFDHLFPAWRETDRPSLEAFTMLAAVGAATLRVTLGILVTRPGLREPGVLAKVASSLDSMTGGRTILGVGVGDRASESEHVVFGLPSLPPRTERVAAVHETILALKALFQGRPWQGGEHVAAMSGPLRPLPAAPGGPPVWVGGSGDDVVRLAARVGDAWNAWGLEAAGFSSKAAMLKEEAGLVGREVAPTWAGLALVGEDRAQAQRLLSERRAGGQQTGALWCGGTEELGAFVDELAGSGCEWTILMPAGPRDRMELIAETVLPGAGVR